MDPKRGWFMKFWENPITWLTLEWNNICPIHFTKNKLSQNYFCQECFEARQNKLGGLLETLRKTLATQERK